MDRYEITDGSLNVDNETGAWIVVINTHRGDLTIVNTPDWLRAQRIYQHTRRGVNASAPQAFAATIEELLKAGN